jgi:hypothetical protein
VHDPLDLEIITTGDTDIAFEAAKRLADNAAEKKVDGPICLAWYDRAADREAPAHANECHGDCEMPGFVEYAVTRGATLKVVVDDGAFVFCYRPIGEFADD